MDGASIMFWILVELLLLGTTAVRTACHIAAEFNYRLVPLNAERAFVASALPGSTSEQAVARPRGI